MARPIPGNDPYDPTGPSRFLVYVYTPWTHLDLGLARAAETAGARGVADLTGPGQKVPSPAELRPWLRDNDGRPLAVRVPAFDATRLDDVGTLADAGLVDEVVLASDPDRPVAWGALGSEIARLRYGRVHVMAEVHAVADGRAALEAGVTGLVVCPADGPGSAVTAALRPTPPLDVAAWLQRETHLPIIVRGGIVPDTAARIRREGYQGLVLEAPAWFVGAPGMAVNTPHAVRQHPEKGLVDAWGIHDEDDLAALVARARGSVTATPVAKKPLVASSSSPAAPSPRPAKATAADAADPLPIPSQEPTPMASSRPDAAPRSHAEAEAAVPAMPAMPALPAAHTQTFVLDEPIAIVGIGCVLPQANDVARFWENLERGTDCIIDVPLHRWDPALFYDPTGQGDRTYTKIGGFITDFQFDSLRFRIPPNMADSLDDVQKMALSAAREALDDARVLDDKGRLMATVDGERVAVIMGNSMGGEGQRIITRRIAYPFVRDRLIKTPAFASLAPQQQQTLLQEFETTYLAGLPRVTEDSMPGELANIISGRIANTFDFQGKNHTVDAACASSFGALDVAVKALVERDADLVITGGADRSMDIDTYVKFCKIGALSPHASTPFDARADGFVMGEGAAVFVLKRLSDAMAANDSIHAVVRGIGSSSDGRGKGITAPNRRGQVLAVRRAIENAGIDPATIQYVEAHGTSTKVGDVVEVESLGEVFRDAGFGTGAVGIGSVKSQIGHLKGAAGAASMLKVVLGLERGKFTPSINFETPNPNIEWSESPFRVITRTEPWPDTGPGMPRRAGISSFGFGGTNFHVVLESFVPAYHRRLVETGALAAAGRLGIRIGDHEAAHAAYGTQQATPTPVAQPIAHESTRGPVLTASPALDALGLEPSPDTLHALLAFRAPLEGEALVLGGPDHETLLARLQETARSFPDASPFLERGDGPRLKDLVHATNVAGVKAPVRLALVAKDLAAVRSQAAFALRCVDDPAMRKMAPVKGVFFGEGVPQGKIALLFPGQGSQYAEMLFDLYHKYAVVRDTFAEADDIMEPLLGQRLTSIIFPVHDRHDEGARKSALAAAEEALRQTEICQPAVLAADLALWRLLRSLGIEPDVVAGHSLGEYAALVAAGILRFEDALFAVSARGKEMANVDVPDLGKMASVTAPFEVVQEVLETCPGYVIPANKNCPAMTVIAGSSEGVDDAVRRFQQRGIQASYIPVSAAFHSAIVAPASQPLRNVLARLAIHKNKVPVYANVTAQPYDTTLDDDAFRDYVLDMLAKQVASPVEWTQTIQNMYADGVRTFIEVGPKRALQGFVSNILDGQDHVALATNHPKKGGVYHLNETYAVLAAMGHRPKVKHPEATAHYTPEHIAPLSALGIVESREQDRRFAAPVAGPNGTQPEDIVIAGTAVGLPGRERELFAADNIDVILSGTNLIDPLTHDERARIANKNIVRLTKSGAGAAGFETINDVDQVIRLAARIGRFDLSQEYGIDDGFVETFDITTKMAIAAALEALKDAGIPLVRSYRRTTTGSYLPDAWTLPAALQDETGIIFASAFPGYDNLLDEVSRHLAARFAGRERADIEALVDRLASAVSGPDDRARIQAIGREQLAALDATTQDALYTFNRKFLFNVLSMGHAQLAQLIKAKGPNAQVNAACSSTTLAVAIAEDWIRNGRCRRVIIAGADDVTSDNMLEWIGAGFLASGAATTEGDITKAALPFDRRRHGMIIGAGAVGLIVEARSETRKRGMDGLVRLLATQVGNSAYHGSRLDVTHIAGQMERLVERAEADYGIQRDTIAKRTMFMSHETYTPARGGSASAEVEGLRHVFGDYARSLVIANTKGFTGHPMGAGIEDAIAVKALQLDRVPPVANLTETDPEFADLTFSMGGSRTVDYALRLAAGFGSQIALWLGESLVKGTDRVQDVTVHQGWIDAMAGAPGARLETVHKTLRITDRGAPDAPEAAAVDARVPPAVPELTAVPAARPMIEAQVTAAAPRSVPEPETIVAHVTSTIAAQTGYPTEMLEPELDMEADLGIDTVKQAELFGTLREHYDFQAEEGMQIKDYPTIRAVAGYIHGRLGSASTPVAASLETSETNAAPLAAPAPAATTPSATVERPAASASAPVTAPAEGGSPGLEAIVAFVTETVRDQTGYPIEMLEPELDMESDLGIDTVKQAELFGTLREHYDFQAEEGMQIKDYPTIRAVASYIDARLEGDDTTASDAPTPVAATPAPTAGTKPAPASAAPKQATLVIDDGAPTGSVGTPGTNGSHGKPGAAPIVAPASPAAAAVPAVTPGPARPPEPAVQPAAPTPVVNQPALDEILAQVTDRVAAQTGYPVEMLEADLDMEADLGIDTVKQAELFGQIRDHFQVQLEEGLQIKDHPTIRHVAGYVARQVAAGTGVTAVPPTVVQAAAPEVSSALKAPVVSAVAPELMAGRPRRTIALDTLGDGAPSSTDTVMASTTVAQSARQIVHRPTVRNLDELQDGAPAQPSGNGHRSPTAQAASLPQPVPASRTATPPPAAITDIAAPDGAPEATASIPSATAATTPPSDVPAATGPTDLSTEEALRRVTQIVADQTGYPVEMLEPDLDMEADLGIDTVKQAELFGNVRTAFDLPLPEGLQIADYPTIRAVAGFVTEHAAASTTAAAIADVSPVHVIPSPPVDLPESDSTAKETPTLPAPAQAPIVRRVPVPVDRPLPAGIDDEVVRLSGPFVVVQDKLGWSDVIAKALTQAGATTVVIGTATPADEVPGYFVQTDLGDVSSIEGAMRSIEGQLGPIGGLIHLASLNESRLPPDAAAFQASTNAQVRSLYAAARCGHARLRSHPGIPVFALTRMGGTFALPEADERLHTDQHFNPMDGGVAGLTKALAKEFPDAKVRIIDLAQTIGPHDAGRILLRELVAEDGRTEVGYPERDRRIGIDLYERPVPRHETFRIRRDDHIVATGGAQGVTAEVMVGLLSRLSAGQRPALTLIGRTALPDDIDALAALDDTALAQRKDALLARLREQHERVTPVMLNEAWGATTKAIEVHRQILRFRALTDRVSYHAVDVTDQGRMEAALNSARQANGPITLVVHGAGTEKSKAIEDKDPDQFDRVFAPKVIGFHNLVVACADDPLRLVLVMSSVAGRFGNIGQVDYSAANDLAVHYAIALGRARSMRAIGLDWSAWGEIGMATRGGIMQVMEASGVTPVPVADGVRCFVDEVLQGDAHPEVVIGGALGAIDAQGQVRFESLAPGLPGLAPAEPAHRPMIDEVIVLEPRRFGVFGRRLDMGRDRYLDDHRVDGVPYLPGVFGVEAFAEAAAELLDGEERGAGYTFAGAEDVRFRLPVKLLKDQPLDLRIVVERIEDTPRDEPTRPVTDDDTDSQIIDATVDTDHVARMRCRIESDFVNPRGVILGEPRVHFTGVVRFAAPRRAPVQVGALPVGADSGHDAFGKAAIYDHFFHGPTFQVLEAIPTIGDDRIAAVARFDHAGLFAHIPQPRFLTAPLAREAAFQAAGFWALCKRDRMSLPESIAGLEHDPVAHGEAPAGTSLIVLARHEHDDADGLHAEYTVEVYTPDGTLLDRMERYRMVKTGTASGPAHVDDDGPDDASGGGDDTVTEHTPDETSETTAETTADDVERMLRPRQPDEVGTLPSDRSDEGDWEFYEAALPGAPAGWTVVDIGRVRARVDDSDWRSRHFTAGEAQRIANGRTLKRRSEHAAGIMAAKRAIQRALRIAEMVGRGPEVGPDPDTRAPRYLLPGATTWAQDLSITHCQDYAAAFIDNGVRPGIDLETVDAMSPAVLEIAFSPADRAVMGRANDARIDTHEGVAARCWVAKESVLKAMGTGLTLPLHAIAVKEICDDGRIVFEAGDGTPRPGRWTVATAASHDGRYRMGTVVSGTRA